MTSKDKPKRGEGRTFVRETKPKAAPAKAEAGAKPFRKDAGKASPKRDAARSGDEKIFRKQSTPAAAAATDADQKPERISKILARAGVASRRDIERMILEGRVTLNGKLLDTPVINVTLDDKVEVDGVPIRGIERTRLWLYHKPGGLVTTNSDPEGRATVFDNLPEGLPRVLSIGRLDINTEGLLLLTNDGGLSRVLELPTTGWLRRYRVRAHGEVDQEALDKLKDGIAVDGVLYGSIEATLDRSQGRNVWITMGLREGKNREIKNVLGALGLEVNRLIRISYGPFQLGDLPEGEALEVRGRTLREQLGPRLIEESKANFEAPLYNEGPAKDDSAARAEKPARAGGDRFETRERDGGRDDRRERAPARGEGRPEVRRDDRGSFDAKPRGKGDFKRDDRDFPEDKPKKRPPMGTSRTANVWMAPGARPTADGKERKTSARAEAEQLFKKPVESDRRVVVNRAVDEEGDWIRADEAPAGRSRDENGGDAGGRRSFGDRAPRGDRPFGDKPRGDRPFGDRPPRGDRPFSDKPRGDRRPREDGDRAPRAERSFGDKPRGDRPFGDRPPRGDRPFSDKPRGDRRPREDVDRAPRAERSFGDKPRGDRAFGDRPPRGDRPFSDKPRGDRRPREDGDRAPRAERSFGDKPRGDRAFGDRPPRGDRPFSDKPRGDRRPREDGDRAPRAERSFGDKPRGERSFSDRPRAERSSGEGRSERPAGDRPYGGKPSGKPGGRPAGKSFGGKPGGGKSFGAGRGKPAVGRPGGGKPSGGRPAGGKPRTPRG
ncbi:MAG: pseudouridine synthase [Neorhizobium sp.]|nr:pseudouridine synthase [Neorhizobium sp.]